MEKIPTLFKRDFEHSNGRYVLPEVTPGCEWVLAGEGVPTRKYDGTCVMFDGFRWWARREVKAGKDDPAGFVLVETDDTTGKSVGWEPAEQSGFYKFLEEAIDYCGDLTPGTYELIGPKINGNPEKYDQHVVIKHEYAAIVPDPTTRTFDSLRFLLTAGYPDEGIVWHHPDGRRMAKLKVRDFPKSE